MCSSSSLLCICLCFSAGVGVSATWWPFAVVEVYETGLPSLEAAFSRMPGSNLGSVLTELGEDTASGLLELSEAAASTLRCAAAALAARAGDGAGDALSLFQGMAGATLHGGAGQGYLWGLVPVTYTQSPHKFCVIVVGLTAESVAIGRAAAKKALTSAAATAAGFAAALLLTATLSFLVSEENGEFPQVALGDCLAATTPRGKHTGHDSTLTPQTCKSTGSQGGLQAASRMSVEARHTRAVAGAAARHSKRARSSPARLSTVADDLF